MSFSRTARPHLPKHFVLVWPFCLLCPLSIIHPSIPLSIHPSIHPSPSFHPSVFPQGALQCLKTVLGRPHQGQVLITLQGHQERQTTVITPEANFKLSIRMQPGNPTEKVHIDLALHFEANDKKLNLNSKMQKLVPAPFSKFRSMSVCFSMTTDLLLLVFTTRIYSSFLHSSLPYVTCGVRMQSPFGAENLLHKIYEEPLLSVSVQLQKCGTGTPPLIKAAAWMDMWVSSAPSVLPLPSSGRLKWGRLTCGLTFFLLPPMLTEWLHLEKMMSLIVQQGSGWETSARQCGDLWQAHALCLLPPIILNRHNFGKCIRYVGLMRHRHWIWVQPCVLSVFALMFVNMTFAVGVCDFKWISIITLWFCQRQ